MAFFTLFVTNIAIDKRVVSTYFGNIAFAYEDYGLPYCFSASLFNTGISEPNGYTKKAMAKIDKDGELNQTATSRSSDELPNIIVVQLESYFDVANAEFFTTSEDACPNLHNLYQNYSNGYFKVPSVGAGTANTEFEVLTGMNLRYFGPGEYPYKTYSKNIRRRVRRQRLPLLDTEHMHYMITQEISTAVPMYLITWDLIHLPVRSL